MVKANRRIQVAFCQRLAHLSATMPRTNQPHTENTNSNKYDL